MIMILGSHTITIQRAASTTDEYGQPEEDWTTPVEVTVSGCSVQPANTSEFTMDRDAITTRMQLFAPANTDIRATDRVVYSGHTYDVDGDPLPWDFPPLSHITALLRRTEG